METSSPMIISISLGYIIAAVCLKQNMNASRLPEYPPVKGKNINKRFLGEVKSCFGC